MFLGIDTSLGTAVALTGVDGFVVAEASSDNPLGHAEVIGELLSSVTRDAAGDIAYVASGMGPGPFTGLRVGIAAARAFALGRGIPIVPVPSHDAVALQTLTADAMMDVDTPRFAVVTDARRREFAYTVYDGLDEDGLPIRATEPALVPRDELDARLAELDARRDDATSVPAAMLGLAASRAVAAGRQLADGQALYLRSPDVTLPHGPKRVSA